MTRRVVITFAINAILLVLVRWFEPDKRYTFGHAHAMDIAVLSLICLLAVTHVVLALVMLVQRQNWLPSEASMFKFIAVKSLFWTNTATTYTMAGRGIKLDLALLFLMMTITTIELDWCLFARYVLGREDELLIGPSAMTDDHVVTSVPVDRRSNVDRRAGWGRMG